MSDEEIVRNLICGLMFYEPEFLTERFPEQMQRVKQLISETNVSKLKPLDTDSAIKIALDEFIDYIESFQ